MLKTIGSGGVGLSTLSVVHADEEFEEGVKGKDCDKSNESMSSTNVGANLNVDEPLDEALRTLEEVDDRVIELPVMAE